MNKKEIEKYIVEGKKHYEEWENIDNLLQKAATTEVSRLISLNEFTEAKKYINDFYKSAQDKESETNCFLSRDLLMMFVIRKERLMTES